MSKYEEVPKKVKKIDKIHKKTLKKILKGEHGVYNSGTGRVLTAWVLPSRAQDMSKHFVWRIPLRSVKMVPVAAHVCQDLPTGQRIPGVVLWASDSRARNLGTQLPHPFGNLSMKCPQSRPKNPECRWYLRLRALRVVFEFCELSSSCSSCF